MKKVRISDHSRYWTSRLGMMKDENWLIFNPPPPISADELAKEARDLNINNTSQVTLGDANAIARYRLKEKTIKEKDQKCDINANRRITKTITRLRTGHLGGIKINADKTSEM